MSRPSSVHRLDGDAWESASRRKIRPFLFETERAILPICRERVQILSILAASEPIAAARRRGFTLGRTSIERRNETSKPGRSPTIGPKMSRSRAPRSM